MADDDAPQVYLLGKTLLANNQGQFYIRNDPIVQMAAGDQHTLIVTKTGRAFAFGENSSGQLGLGHTERIEKVSCIKSLKFTDSGEKVILVACGRDSSLVATSEGSLYGFGSNACCQLGSESKGHSLNHAQPVKIERTPASVVWQQLSMGAEHACALTKSGQVYVWGSNSDGQCGLPRDRETIKTPQELKLLYKVKAISCGYYHTALISEDGRLFTMGNNDDRQLGRSASEKQIGPLQVSIRDPVKAVACGHQHTVVLTEKGQMFVCGHGDRGQLGLGPGVKSAETFELVDHIPKRVTAIAAGEAHTAAVVGRGELYVFGDGKHGKLGPKIHTNEFEPCFVERFNAFTVLNVVCGGCQTIVLAQKKNENEKKSSDSEDGERTLSVTQRSKSEARDKRIKTRTELLNGAGDSFNSADMTIRNVRPLGTANNFNQKSTPTDARRSTSPTTRFPNSHIRTEPNPESGGDESHDEMSASIKSATFNQTHHTLNTGKLVPTHSPTLNRTSFGDSRRLKTGILDHKAELDRVPSDTDDLKKTPASHSRLAPLDKLPVRNTRFDRASPPDLKKKPIIKDKSDDDDGSSDEERRTPRVPPSKSSFVKKSESPPPPPISTRSDKRSPDLRRRNEKQRSDDSESGDDEAWRKKPATTGKTTKPTTSMSETLTRKAPPKITKRHQGRSDDDEDDDDEEEEDKTRLSSRTPKPQQPPPIAARRGSLPHQARSSSSVPPMRDGNQTIGSRPVDGVRGSFRTPATKTLARPNTTDTTAKPAPATQQPGFFSRIFGRKPEQPSTPPPPEAKTSTPAAKTSTPAATNANSRACSLM